MNFQDLQKRFSGNTSLRFVFLLAFMLMLLTNIQSATYYLITANQATAGTAANWDTDNTGGGGGTNATNFTTNGDIFIILSSQTATFGASTTFGSATAAVTLQIEGTASISSTRTLTIGVSGASSTVIFTLTSANSITGAGTFTLASGSTLRTANTNGITGASGSVNCTTKNLNTGANYQFNGSSTQTATGLPTTVATLTIDNSAGVNLVANLITTGVVITTGTLDATASNFTIRIGSGGWTNNGGDFNGQTSGNVTFNTSCTMGGTTATTGFAGLLVNSGVTVTMNTDNTCKSLTIVAAGTDNNFTHGGTAVLTVNGAVNVNQGTGNGDNGKWNINAGSATVSGLISLLGSNTTTSRTSEIILTTGTLNADGGITFVAAAAACHVINMSGGASTLNLKGTLTVPAASSTLTAGTTSTFNYVDNVAQTINYFSAGAYNNLGINNTHSSGATLSAAITSSNVTGNLNVGNVNSGSTFNTGNFAVGLANSKTLTVSTNSTMVAGTSVVTMGTSATVTLNGIFKTANLTAFTGNASGAISSTNSPTISLGSSSTIEYNSASTQPVTARTDYANVTLSSSSKTMPSGTVTLSGSLTINGSTTYNGTSNNPTLNIAGDFSNAGTFNQGSNTVTFNGTAQQIGGSSSTTFGNVVIDGGGTKTMTGNITVSSTLTMTSGKLSLGANTLTLSSGLSGTSSANCFIGSGTSNLTINGTGTLSGSIFMSNASIAEKSLNNLTINRTSTGIVTLGDTMIVYGTLTPTNGDIVSNGLLVIGSDAASTGSVISGSGTFTGDVRVQRFIPALASRRFRFLSACVSSATLGDWKGETHITGTGGSANNFDETASNFTSVYSYDETVTGGSTNGWIAASNGVTDALPLGKGFRLFIRGTRDPGRLDGSIATQDNVTLDLTGTLNISDVSPTITFSSSGGINEDGWNLIGNPFAAAFSWNALHDQGRSLISDTINYNGTNYAHLSPSAYIYDGKTNSYAAYNAVSDVAVGNFSGGIVPSGSSFFVHASATSPSITLKESARTSTTPGALFKSGNTPYFGISFVKDSINSDEMILEYNNDALSGFDAMDIPKVYGGEVNLATIGTDGGFFAANFKPLNTDNIDTVYLSMGIRSTGSYTFLFHDVEALLDDQDLTVTLIDKFAQKTIDLRTNDFYQFSANTADNASFGNNRFMIVIGPSHVGIPETIESNTFYLFPSLVNNELALYASTRNVGDMQVSITDLTGRTVFSRDQLAWENHHINLPVDGLKSGVYFVRAEDKKSHQMVVLKFVKE